MILTKKYRLIWEVDTKNILIDPYIEYSNNTTLNTNSLGYYDSDSISDINDKIDEEQLILPSEDVEQSIESYIQ